MNVCRAFRAPALLLRTLSFNPRLNCKRLLADENRDAPVKFSASAASGWKASLSRQGLASKDVSAWFQPYVIVLSFAALLIYFCILREESDIDEMLTVTLYDRIEGLEKAQLEACLEYNTNNNLPTAAIKKRLLELEEEELRLFGHKK